MIEVKNLIKNYGSCRAIDGISFTLNKGEILGLLGPNGAGKTTTMRIITGFIPPSSGTVKVCGYDITEHPIQVKRKIGYLPENPPLYNEMIVHKYLKYVAELKDVNSKKIASSVEKVIDLCNLGVVKDRIVGNLSKGFRQRTGLAQALINDPEILILDEPTSGLDPKQIIEIRNLIKSLAGNRTVILSSHILPEVQMTCESVIILNKGKIVAVDHQKNLSKYLNGNNSYEMTLSKKISKKFINFIKDFEGVLDVGLMSDKNNAIYIDTKGSKDIRSKLIKSTIDNEYEILEFKTKDVSLEDVFMKLTTEEVNNA
ncbi:MAG: ATP-binding cassette domain-containing protein [Proteobacteria bacterium]|nr:ATP-binding cassette domain-containing protein [Pseudomonadota bacterium]